MIELQHITKTYKTEDGGTLNAVEDASISVKKGEIFGIIGFSGAGKSTLVRCINLLERPTSGSVSVNGQDMLALDQNALRAQRKKIGMIFQHFNLMKSRTVGSNVEFPLKYGTLSKEQRAARVRTLLDLVEISDKINAFPNQLSGGQKQRVAIARALANEPDVLLCDEATSALDPTTTKAILHLLKRLNQQLGITIVLITHQMNVIKEICDRVAVMEHGRIVEQGDVFSIFANPQEQVTKNFIHTTSHLHKIDELLANGTLGTDMQPGQKIIRFTFLQKSVSEPLISTVTREFGVTLNVIFADIEIVQGAPIGGTVAIVSGAAEAIEKALAYLAEKHVGIEVIQDA